MNIIQYLITEIGCDSTIPDNKGSLPLHNACYNGKHYYAIIIINNYRRTVLHYANCNGHIDIVQWFLHDGRIDLMAKDYLRDSCVDLIIKQQYHLLKLFQPFVESTKRFPIHTYGKTVLTGNSGAGKTTLAKVITE